MAVDTKMTINGYTANAAMQPTQATPDQEVWVRERIRTAMKMAISLYRSQDVRADGPSFDYGFDGIAEGTAVEVIRTLGMTPAFINVRNLPPGGALS